MKVVALISGGKDSCYNMMQCVINGHDIVALANLKPPVVSGKDELDSFMYQTVGHDAIHMYSECMDLPLYRREIVGGSVSQGSDYTTTADDETEDLYALLQDVLTHHPDVKGVSVGAILSNYQRVRVEHVCNRLGLTSLAYLWRRDQKELLYEMANAGVNAVLIKIAAIGLKTVHLGKSIGQMYPLLCRMNEMYELHICGEGGEYETFTLDCPLFKKRIEIEETETVIHSDDAFAQVAYLKLIKCRVVDKKGEDMDMSRTIKHDWKEWEHYDRVADALKQPSAPIQLPTVSASVPPTVTTVSTSSKHHPYYAIGGTTAYDINKKAEYTTIEEETVGCMSNVEVQLQQYGLSWSDVVTMNVFVKDMDDFGRINSVYKTYFGINPSPRALVGVHLRGPSRLQIDLTAIQSAPKDTMHVQGISYWAPANIGPYSQSVMASCHAYIAGQIGLIPSTLELPTPASFGDELILSLRNLENIVSALKLSLQEDVSLCYCYVTQTDYLSAASTAWDGYVAHKPPTLFIVVPSLPKGAKIEWQVMLNTLKASVYPHEDDFSDDDLCSSLSTLDIHHKDQNDMFHMYSKHGVTTMVLHSKGNALKKIVSDMIHTMQSKLQNRHILTLRVYYDEKYELTSAECSQLFIDALVSQKMPVPAITAIPVISIGESNIACAVHAL